jgi:hypothetical protein
MPPPPKFPRSILKQTSATLGSPTRAAKVHFPPSPRLSTFQFTHSPQLYDRSPLVVQPNVCALPKRGERVYLADDYDSATQDDIIRDSIPLREGYLPPECPREPSTYPPPSLDYPPSSGHQESDESDSPPSTPPEPTSPSGTVLIVSHAVDVLGPSISRRRSDSEVLDFLPHPPSPGKPKRPKRNVKRTCGDQPALGFTFSKTGSRPSKGASADSETVPPYRFINRIYPLALSLSISYYRRLVFRPPAYPILVSPRNRLLSESQRICTQYPPPHTISIQHCSSRSATPPSHAHTL